MSENIIENASAINYFNEEAEKLLGLLVEMKETEIKKSPLKSVQEEVLLAIDESEVEYSFKAQIDYQGNETARYFQVSADKWLGIDGDNYQEIRKLSANLYKKREINDRIGKETLIKIVFDWMKTRCVSTQGEPLSFVEYLNESIQKIENVKISIPIINMEIDLEFEVGKVRFEYMKKELFDEIDAKMKEKVVSKELPENEYTEFVSKLRKDHQGKVVGTIHVKAETEKAIEIAEKEVDRAIVALKYFSPFAFVPRAAAIFGRKGMTWIPSREIFVFTDTLPTIHQGLVGNQSLLFKIDGVLLAKLKAAGLAKLSELILKSDLSEFEELIFTALYTFSKAISQIDFHERLIFILSALEIVFLKDSGEPIQIHVGQRLGFLTSPEPDKRRETVLLVSDGYKIRSNYIHHGQENENYEILSKLQRACWNALSIMINNHNKFKNKQEFMSYIEKLIYS